MRFAIALVLVLIAWQPVGHAGPLQDGYRAGYSVTRNGLPLGESVRTVQRQPDGSWRADAVTEPTGLAGLLFSDVIEEHSTLRVANRRVQPLQYSYDRHGGRKDQRYQLRFDWPSGQLHLLHSAEQLALPAGTQDPLSFVLEVMYRLRDGERQFAMAIAGRKHVRDYRVQIVAERVERTTLGPQAVMQVLASEIGKDTVYDLWCLPDHDYLPLRIRQRRGDEITDLRLHSLSSPPAVTLHH